MRKLKVFTERGFWFVRDAAGHLYGPFLSERTARNFIKDACLDGSCARK